jgi:LysM repeat protein
MVEGVNEKIAMLEKQDKTLLRSNSLRKRSINANAALLKKLSQETEGLKKKMASAVVKPPATQAAKVPKKAPADKRYHLVQAGESLYGIAKRYGISTEDLCKINNISSKQVISPGQKLLVKPESGK